MSDFVETILGFAVGFISGVVSILALSFYYAKKEMRKNSAKIKDFYQELDKVRESLKKATDVQDRVNKVKEIAKEQLEMQMRIEAPQKNALDGQYKNQLSRDIRAMEEEKRSILQSILDDGFDPEITIINSESKLETMKLSQFMGKTDQSTADTARSKLRGNLRLIKSTEQDQEESP